MVTKLMNRLFSEVDDEFLNDLDEAKRKGILNKVNIQYIRQPDQTIKVNDRDNGETTIIKKSGSSIIMKSGDDDALPNSIRSMGAILDPNAELNASELIDLFSEEFPNNDKLFSYFGQNPLSPLSRDDENRVRERLKDTTQKIEELEDQIEENSNKVKTGSENDLEHDKYVKERNSLRLDILKAKELGYKGMLSKNKNYVNDATKKISDAEIKMNDINAKDTLIKQKIDKDNKVNKSTENNSGYQFYKVTTGNKALTTGRKTFSKVDRFFSHAGYENEHTLLIGKLSEIKIAPNEHSKNKLLGDLEKLIDQIKDDSITKITKPMLSELKKLKLNDPQYSEIINDLIESVTTDSVTRLFAVNRVVQSGHYIDDPKLMEMTRTSALNQEVDLNPLLRTVGGLALGYGALNMGMLNPVLSAAKAAGNTLSTVTQGGNIFASAARYLMPWTQLYKQRQAENQAEDLKYRDENGNPNNMQAEFKLNPIASNLKAMIPFTDYNKYYRQSNSPVGKAADAIHNSVSNINQAADQTRANGFFNKFGIKSTNAPDSVQKQPQRPRESNSKYAGLPQNKK